MKTSIAADDIIQQFSGLFNQACLQEQCLQMLAQAPMAISITDLKANIQYVNPYFSELTGYSLDEIKGRNHSLLSYKATPDEIYQSLWQAIKGGQKWQGCLINRRKNGQRYLADVSIAGLYDSEGKLSRYIGIHQDITERHDTHTQISNQKIQLEAVLNAAPVCLALLNDQGEIVLDNLSYKTLASDINAEPCELALASLFDGEKPKLSTRLSTQKAEGWSVSIKTQAMDSKRWFNCQLSSLKLYNPEVDNFFKGDADSLTYVLTMSEFTKQQMRRERKRINELARMTAESEALHAMQEALHAAIHQIQGPINMIDAAVNFLCSGNQSCPKVSAMKMGVEAGNAAIQQLQQALPERPHEAMQPVNINQLVHEVTAMSNQRLLKSSISVQLQLTGVLPAVTGQPDRLRVAFKQLLDNAIDAIDYSKSSQREIVLSTSADADQVQLQIEDSGPGIQDSLKLKVFEPFYSTKPLSAAGCRGVGLSIVQQVLSEHRGLMQFERSELGGCKAVFSLPTRQQGGE